jgi:hypothetical protein
MDKDVSQKYHKHEHTHTERERKKGVREGEGGELLTVYYTNRVN